MSALYQRVAANEPAGELDDGGEGGKKLEQVVVAVGTAGEVGPTPTPLPLVPRSHHLLRAPPCRVTPCSIVRVLGSFMIGVVLSIVYCSFVPMWRYYGGGGARDSAVLALFHVLVSLLVSSYLRTVFTDPGTVPGEWQERVAALKRSPYDKCRRSGLFKPPRAHFDSVTRRLVLNMDHFCPWVNNCVGYFNRKFFILFVGYCALTCSFTAVALGLVSYAEQAGMVRPLASAVLSPHAVAGHEPPTAPPGSAGAADGSAGLAPPPMPAPPMPWPLSYLDVSDTSLAVMTLMGALLDAIFGVVLTCFCAAHLWMAARNQTSIEGQSASHSYRLSVERNLEQVFGADKRLWLLPVWGEGPVGDGVHWPLAGGGFDGCVYEADPEPASAGAAPATDSGPFPAVPPLALELAPRSKGD